jgi:hypothetical protein
VGTVREDLILRKLPVVLSLQYHKS